MLLKVDVWLGAEGRGGLARVPHSVFHCCEQLPEKQFREGRFILAQVPEGSQFPVGEEGMAPAALAALTASGA